jgi:predicted nucleic acid-binding protein
VYLADTSAWNRSGRVQERWHELIEQDALALCSPVRLELFYSARGPQDYRELEATLWAFPVLPVDARIEMVAEHTQAALVERGQHRGPAPVDLLIAAIAEVHGVTLLHYDRHFDAIGRVSGQPMEWLARRGSLD